MNEFDWNYVLSYKFATNATTVVFKLTINKLASLIINFSHTLPSCHNISFHFIMKKDNYSRLLVKKDFILYTFRFKIRMNQVYIFHKLYLFEAKQKVKGN